MALACSNGSQFALLPAGSYADPMPHPSPPPSPPPRRLLSVEKVRALATTADPDYGREFSEADWERITERLEALARLLWAFSQDQVEAQTPTKPPSPPTPGSASDLP